MIGCSARGPRIEGLSVGFVAFCEVLPGAEARPAPVRMTARTARSPASDSSASAGRP